MGHYKSNLRDIEFNLFEVLGRDKVYGTGPFEEMDVDTAKSVLDELCRLAENEFAESFADADRNPPVFDPRPTPRRSPPPSRSPTRPSWTPSTGVWACPRRSAAPPRRARSSGRTRS